MRSILLHYISLFFVFFTLTNCTKQRVSSSTDYDQLYTLKSTKAHKDSIAIAIAPSVQKALSLPNTKKNRTYIQSVLKELRWTRDSISMRKLANKAMLFATTTNDDHNLGDTYNNLAVYYHKNDKLDSVYFYYVKAQNVYETLHDTIKIGESEFYQARLLYELGLYFESESKLSRSLHLLNKEKEHPIHLEANKLMALNLIEYQNYPKAELYFLSIQDAVMKDYGKFEKLSKKYSDFTLTSLKSNLASIYFAQKQYQKAIVTAEEGLLFTNSKTHPVVAAYLDGCIAKSKFALYKNPKYIAQAESIHCIYTAYNYGFHMTESAQDIAQMYFAIHDDQTAFKWARKSLESAIQFKLLNQQRSALELILSHQVVHQNNDVNRLIDLNHQIKNQESTARSTFSRIQYEVNLVVAENLELKHNVVLMSIVGCTIILLMLFLFYFFRLRTREQELKASKIQQATNDSIYQLIFEKNTIVSNTKKSERTRIASALHDGLVSGLFTTRFNLQQLETPNNKLKETLITELQKLEKEAHAISHDLQYNTLFNDNNFIDLIYELSKLQLNEWGTLFTISNDDDIDLNFLTPNQRVNAYYIIREAIHNINKYSKATQSIIRFTTNTLANTVIIEIQDNGIGFNPLRITPGMGIQNMEKRATLFNSKLTIVSSRNKGTSIRFEIPTNNRYVS